MPVHEYKVNTNTHTNPNGHNEVHRDDCPQYPHLTSVVLLGEHTTCGCAVELAKAKGYNADGCRSCIPDCHRG